MNGGSVTTEGYLTFAVRAHRLHGYDGTPGRMMGFPEILLYNGGYAIPSFCYLPSSRSVPTVPAAGSLTFPAPKVKPNPPICRPCVRRDGEIPELSNRMIHPCKQNVECLHARTRVPNVRFPTSPVLGSLGLVIAKRVSELSNPSNYTLLYDKYISSGNYTSHVDSRSDRLFETIMDMVRLILIFRVVCRGYITI